jgi:hypothetical protein
MKNYLQQGMLVDFLTLVPFLFIAFNHFDFKSYLTLIFLIRIQSIGKIAKKFEESFIF